MTEPILKHASVDKYTAKDGSTLGYVVNIVGDEYYLEKNSFFTSELVALNYIQKLIADNNPQKELYRAESNSKGAIVREVNSGQLSFTGIGKEGRYERNEEDGKWQTAKGTVGKTNGQAWFERESAKQAAYTKGGRSSRKKRRKNRRKTKRKRK
jgi:hypothetical protein